MKATDDQEQVAPSETQISKASELEARINLLEQMIRKNSLNAARAVNPWDQKLLEQIETGATKTPKKPSPKKRPSPIKKSSGNNPLIDLKRLDEEEKRVESELMAIERELIRKRGRG